MMITSLFIFPHGFKQWLNLVFHI